MLDMGEIDLLGGVQWTSYDKAIEDVGEANAMIFEIHQMMLDDLDYLESIEGIIRTQSVNAEYAVSTKNAPPAIVTAPTPVAPPPWP